MASYNTPILIQKFKEKDEAWEDYFKTRANINKIGGKEFFKALTNISSAAYTFKVRYSSEIQDIIFYPEMYRIVYDGKIFDVKNVDRFNESKTEATILGEFNRGQNNFNR